MQAFALGSKRFSAPAAARLLHSSKNSSQKSWSTWKLAGAAGLAVVGGVVVAEDILHVPEQPWSHNGPLSAYDTASLRRGYQVYTEVCAMCHGLKLIAHRNLVGVTHTEAEAKAIAADKQYRDGPDDKGEMFERPGKLADYFQNPYPNDEAAKAGNNGAMPPDLSLITKARHGGADYIFALLTGYRDPPPGVTLGDGQHYNPYFPGAKIAMPPPLMSGQVDYEDGTEASLSQMSKDVSAFLTWCAEPEADERKLMGVKWIAALSFAALGAAYFKRFKWSIFKGRKIRFD